MRKNKLRISFVVLKRFFLRRHLLFIALLLIVLLGPLLWFITNKPGGVEAAWWNDSYMYRKAVEITNAGSDQTDYQVLITLDTASLISAGKMQSDCDDIRITDINGQTLAYWIEENSPGCNDANTEIWTKTPSITTGGAAIYIYYGNPDTFNNENGADVFEFFDDFSGSGLDTSKWTATGGYSISGGEIMVTTGAVYTNNTVASTAQNYIYEYRNKWTNTSGSYSGLQIADEQGTSGGNSGSNALIYYMAPSAASLGIQCWAADGNTAYYNLCQAINQYTATQDTYYVDSFSIDSTDVIYYNNRAQTYSYTGTWTEPPYLWLGYFSGSNAGTTDGKNMTTDWVLVRKHDSGVSIASPGSEENAPGPIAYWKFDEGYGSTANDSTQNNNDGTLGTGSSAPAWQTEDMCISGKCLKFDGGDYVQNSNPSGTSSTSGTVNAWVKVNDLPAVSDIAVIAGVFENSSDQDQVYIRVFNQSSTLRFSLSIRTGATNRAVAYTNNSFNLNTWYHITLTGGANGNTLYVNGVPQILTYTDGNSSTTQWTSAITNSFLMSGGRQFNSSPEKFLNGFIDEAKVYPYARSETEIKSDFIKGSTSHGSSAVLGAKDQSYLSEGLVGYWKMDENTGTTINDFAGIGNTGSFGVGSSAPSWVGGKFGNGLNFDGTNDYLNLGNPSDLNFTTGNFTIAFWMKSDKDIGEFPIWKGGYFTDEGYCFYKGSSGNISFEISDGSNDSQISSGTNVEDGVWHHVVGVRNNGKIQIYVDGQYRGEANDISGDLSSSQELNFGKYSNASYFYEDYLDEVRIYNRSLSSKEVRNLYNWAPGPVGYWKLDEGTGTTTVYDRSGNGNNGTMNGSMTESDWVPGKYGKGLNTDTNDYIDTSINLANSKQGSYSLWVKNLDIDDSNWTYLLQATTGSNCNEGIPLQRANTSMGYYIASNSESISIYTSNTLELNTWQHLAVTWDTSSVKFYIDGILAGSDTNINLTDTSDWGNIRFGGGYCSSANANTEIIDDVRYYNYARTQKQITEDMNGGHPMGGSPVGSQIGYWQFDGGYGTTAYDSSPQGNNGTLGTGSSAPSWSNNGKYGKALSFDGNDSVNVGTSFALDNSFTITTWLNASSIVQNTGPWSKLWSYPRAIMTSGGSMAVQMKNVNSDVYATSYTNAISTNHWYHHTFVYNHSTFEMHQYLDGILKTTDTLPLGAYSGSGTFYIGYNQWYFNGLIDELKIYNSALTEDEVKLDYNQGKSLVMGVHSVNTGSTAPGGSSAQEYCVPGDSSACSPPVAEWSFNEKTGTSLNDVSGNGNTGTLGSGNSAPEWVHGKFSGGLKFDGTNDYVASSNNPFTASELSSGTINFWVNLNTLNNGDDQQLLSLEHMVTFRLLDASNEFEFAVYDGDSQNVTSSAFPSEKKWYFITGVWDASNLELFVNGQSQGTQPQGSPVLDSQSRPLELGRRPACCGSDRYANGIVDNVRIYDYARSDVQIAWDYNRGKPVGWWQMDECQGSTAYDSSGFGNNGSINIGATAPQTSAGTCTDGQSTSAWYNGVDGKYNSSLNFDGADDDVNCGSDSSIDFTLLDEFSLAGWINPDTVSGGVDLMLNKGYVRFGQNNNKAYAYFHTGASYTMESATGTISVDNWHHIAMIKTSNNYQLFLNGRLVDTENVGDKVTDSSGYNLFIGKYTTGLYRFDGQIDEVKIFNYALTKEQIQGEYTGGAVRFGN